MRDNSIFILFSALPTERRGPEAEFDLQVFTRRYGRVVAAYTRAGWVKAPAEGEVAAAPEPCCIGFGFWWSDQSGHLEFRHKKNSDERSHRPYSKITISVKKKYKNEHGAIEKEFRGTFPKEFRPYSKITISVKTKHKNEHGVINHMLKNHHLCKGKTQKMSNKSHPRQKNTRPVKRGRIQIWNL